MGEPRPEKVAIVAEVKSKLDAAEGVVLTEYRGLDVGDLAALRNAMREAGGEYKVYKNTLVRFAAAELDLEIEELLVGPTALAFTGTRPDGSPGDVVGVAKAVSDFSKDKPDLVIKGGLLAGRALSADEVVALSKIAPREELLARLAGGFAAPLQQFAALVAALPQKFAYALSALIEAGGAPGAPAEPQAAADEAASEPEAADEAAPEPEAADEAAPEPEAADEAASEPEATGDEEE
jgi:large subunit ribosomal protein L10